MCREEKINIKSKVVYTKNRYSKGYSTKYTLKYSAMRNGMNMYIEIWELVREIYDSKTEKEYEI